MQIVSEVRRCYFLLISTLALALVALDGSTTACAQISKGNQILINRGLMLQGMITSGDVFNLSTYQAASYNTLDWLWDSDTSRMGAAPGPPWARWVSDPGNMPPQGGEGPFLSQLVALQLADEWNLNDDTIRSNLVDW